jgi:hypothetical protein
VKMDDTFFVRSVLYYVDHPLRSFRRFCYHYVPFPPMPKRVCFIQDSSLMIRFITQMSFFAIAPGCEGSFHKGTGRRRHRRHLAKAECTRRDRGHEAPRHEGREAPSWHEGSAAARGKRVGSFSDRGW